MGFFKTLTFFAHKNWKNSFDSILNKPRMAEYKKERGNYGEIKEREGVPVTPWKWKD